MESLNKYTKALTNPNPTEEDKKYRDEFEDFSKRGNRYIEYVSLATQDIITHGKKVMENLKIANQMSPNPYYEETIQTLEQIASTPSKREELQAQEQKTYEKEQKLVLSKQKKDGFTNATILIYIAINLGLFLASLLLILR